MADQIIVPIIVACIAALPGVVALIIQRKKTAAETADAISDAALALLEPYKAEVKRLRAEIETLRKLTMELEAEKDQLSERLDDLAFENGSLKAWAKTLVCQVIELGGTPVEFEEKTRPRRRQEGKRS